MLSNKIKLVALLLIFAIIPSCRHRETPTFSIAGNIKNYQKSTLNLLLEEDIYRKQNRVISEIPVDKNGNFEMDFNLEPHIYTINFDDEKNITLAIDKNQKVVISGDADDWSTVKVSGSADTEKLEGYEAFRKKSLDSLVISVREKIKQLKDKSNPADDAEIARLGELEIENYDKHKDELINYIEKNMGTSIAVYATSIRWDGDRNLPFLESLATAFQKDHPQLAVTEKIVEKVKILKNTSIGGTAAEIKMRDRNGMEIPLSSIKEKSSIKSEYILIDFWASWCAPCRRESAELVRMYDKFKSRGFEIYGVGLETEKAAWLNAIEQDKRTWINVSTLQEFETPVTFQYAVTALPANFLIDADGKIIAKNLHGAELENKIESLFVE